MNFELALKEFGLTNKEAQVYVELLPLGQVSLHEVEKRLDLPRSTVYHTLNYLIGKGLVATIIRDKKTLYSAADPEKFKEVLKEKEKLIDDILPSLKSLKASMKMSSSVEIYEGFKGIHTILSDLTKVKQEVYYFGCYTKSLQYLKHLPDYVRRSRIDKGIPAKMVYDYTDEPILHTKEYRAVSELRFHEAMKTFPAMVFIYGDVVSMFGHKSDLVGVIIRNKDIAEAMKFIFTMFWDQATPANLV